MDRKEADLFISKIRQKYKDYSKKYGSSIFNINPFEERFQLAIKRGMDMETFILAEIDFLKKLKEKYDEKTNVGSSNREFSKKVDNIIDENNAKIEKYPEIRFHGKAGFEITHFFGAINEFAECYFSALRLMYIDPEYKKKYDELENRLAFFAVSMGTSYPKRIEDHILLISRTGVNQAQIDRDATDYLKNSAFLLHDIMNFCDTMLMHNPDFLQSPLHFSKILINGKVYDRVGEIFKGMTGSQAVNKIKEQAAAIIDDFRLRAFKRS